MKTANKCRVCRRKANEEMILCDKCNRGYHIYCLKPPINSIDEIEGDWFCYSCVPSEATTSKKNAFSKLTTKNDANYNHKVDEKLFAKSEPGCSKPHKKNDEVCLACKDQLDDKYDEVSFVFIHFLLEPLFTYFYFLGFLQNMQ